MNPFSDVDFVEQERDETRRVLAIIAAMIAAMCGDYWPLIRELLDSGRLKYNKPTKPRSSP